MIIMTKISDNFFLQNKFFFVRKNFWQKKPACKSMRLVQCLSSTAFTRNTLSGRAHDRITGHGGGGGATATSVEVDEEVVVLPLNSASSVFSVRPE